MKYSAVIFDWDGTLGMTLHIWLDAYKTELKNLGYDYPDRVIIDDFFYEHKKTIEKYPHIDFDPYIAKVREYMISNVPLMKTYEGVHDSLKKLQQKGITLTLVSSSPRKLLKEILEITGLTEYFSAISGFDDIMKHKPDPEPFLNMIKVAKIDPRGTIIIGDSHADIVAAKAAGIDSCLFLPPENKIFYDFEKLKELGPTFHVESLEQFVEKIIDLA